MNLPQEVVEYTREVLEPLFDARVAELRKAPRKDVDQRVPDAVRAFDAYRGGKLYRLWFGNTVPIHRLADWLAVLSFQTGGVEYLGVTWVGLPGEHKTKSCRISPVYHGGCGWCVCHCICGTRATEAQEPGAIVASYLEQLSKIHHDVNEGREKALVDLATLRKQRDDAVRALTHVVERIDSAQTADGDELLAVREIAQEALSALTSKG